MTEYQIQRDRGSQSERSLVQQLRSETINNEEIVHGDPSKPREADPSMKEILSWDDDERDRWNFRTSNKQLLEDGIQTKLKYKINRTFHHWCTENMDQYRDFSYSPRKKVAFYKFSEKALDATMHGIDPHQEPKLRKSRPRSATVSKPRYLSEAHDQFSLRRLQKEKDVKGYQNELPLVDQGPRKQFIHYPDGEPESEPEEPEIIPPPPKQKKKKRYEEIADRLYKVKAQKTWMDETDPVKRAKLRKLQKQKVKEFVRDTRELPNTAFKTYFGKAPFETYGLANKNPMVGGVVYGQYMQTHNLNPQQGGNKPEFVQVYNHADFVSGKLFPQPEHPPKEEDEGWRPIKYMKKKSPPKKSPVRTLRTELAQEAIKVKNVEELPPNRVLPEPFKGESRPFEKPDLLKAMKFASVPNGQEQPTVVDVYQKKNKLAGNLKDLHEKATDLRLDAFCRPWDDEYHQVPSVQTVTPAKSKSSLASALQEKFNNGIEQRNQALAELYQPQQPEVIKPSSYQTVQQPKGGQGEDRGFRSDTAALEQTFGPSTVKKAEENRRLYEAETLKPLAEKKDNNLKLSPREKDPRNYKNLPGKWTKMIPTAGKQSEPHEDIHEVFNCPDKKAQVDTQSDTFLEYRRYY